MFLPSIIELFGVQPEACSKQTQLYFLWFVQSKMYFHSWCIFMIHLVLLELPPSISVIDWFQKSSSDWSVSLVYLRSHWGKKQSCLHSSSFADALVCSNLALHFKDFFSFCLSVHYRPKALSIRGSPFKFPPK